MSRLAALLGFYALLLVGGHWISTHIEAILYLVTRDYSQVATLGMIVAVVTLYIIMTAVPFVPGAEVGFALIMVFGIKIVALVYAATIMALVLSFAVGRLVPETRLNALFHLLGWERAASMLNQFMALDEPARVRHLVERAPKKWMPFILKHRFWAVALLINLPGNTLLGGGGGIALLAGLSRMISPAKFAACVALAVAPVPLAVILACWMGG